MENRLFLMEFMERKASAVILPEPQKYRALGEKLTAMEEPAHSEQMDPEFDEIRRQWLRSIGMMENCDPPSQSGVCKNHFTRDSFSNFMKVELGYAKSLRLKREAIPTLALPPLRKGPPTLLPRHRCDFGRQSEPKPTKEVGCQTDCVVTKNALVQADMKPFRRSKAIQFRTPSRSVSCDTGTMMDIPPPESLHAASTPLKRQRCEVSASDPSFHLDDRESTVNCTSTCTEVRPHKEKKYIVHEEELLGLFRRCPVCSSPCSVDTMTVGTMLRVTQKCSRCEHYNQWSSQPTVNNIPAGNLQLCAAVHFTGSSFTQISKFLRAFNVQGLSEQCFYRCQARLLIPTVSWQRKLEQDDVIKEAIDCDPVTLGGDVRADSPDVQQVLVIKEELPAEDESWSLGPDQEDQKPPKIKEEQEDAEITQFVFDPVSIKSEDDEEKPHLSELHHSKTGRNRDDAGSEPDECLETDEEEKTSDSSETDISDGNWEESSEAGSGSDSARNDKSPADDGSCERGEKVHICGECGKAFKRRSCLVRHNRIHTGEKPFSCSVCNKAFTWKRGLVIHMRTHSGEKPFSCSVCGQRFSRKESVTSHMRCHSTEKPFSCSVCGKRFNRKENVIRHMRCHTEEKPFSCSVCGQKFGRKESLSYHMTHHTTEKPYSCSVCNKAFTLKGTLMEHTRFHTEDRPFGCSVCKTAFKRKAYLTEHKKIHTGEKPFSCSVCGRSFRQSNSLKRHMRSHTEEKPYSCPVCQATFKWKSACVKHVKNHTGE